MANRWPSRVGECVGRLTVIADTGERAGRCRILLCACACGRQESVPGYRLGRIDACSVCRAPICRHCGAKFSAPSRARTCSPQCRRALTATLAQESYVRGGDERRAKRVAYNSARLAARDPATAAREDDGKRESDRRRRLARLAADPDFAERESARKYAHEAKMSRDAEWRAKRAAKTRRGRAEAARAAMLADLAGLNKEHDR